MHPVLHSPFPTSGASPARRHPCTTAVAQAPLEAVLARGVQFGHSVEVILGRPDGPAATWLRGRLDVATGIQRVEGRLLYGHQLGDRLAIVGDLEGLASLYSGKVAASLLAQLTDADSLHGATTVAHIG